MKLKKFTLPAVFLAITIALYIAASLVFSYTTKPEIPKGEFPFSITYEYKGERGTLSGVYECEYSGSGTIWGEHSRHWSGVEKYDNPKNLELPFVIVENEEMTLAIQINMYADYFMGDPLGKDYYAEHGYEGVEPYAEYHDYKNDISTNDENRDEILEKIGFKFIDYSYAEPIENSFSISGVSYSGDNVGIFVLVMLVFLLLCLIFVRKDKELKYSTFDKIGLAINFIMGIVVIPLITVLSAFFELVISGDDLFGQLTFTVPPLAVLCLALSIVFRRKGYSKTGFFIQFGGMLAFVLMLLTDLI